jgi:hypothetical protein
MYEMVYQNSKSVTAEPVKGDVSGDGKIDVTDVVLLQKWLLAVSDTNPDDWKAGDLNENDRLDVSDLCLIKQMVIDTKSETPSA